MQFLGRNRIMEAGWTTKKRANRGTVWWNADTWTLWKDWRPAIETSQRMALAEASLSVLASDILRRQQLRHIAVADNVPKGL